MDPDSRGKLQCQLAVAQQRSGFQRCRFRSLLFARPFSFRSYLLGGTKWNQLKQAQVQSNELALQRENLINSLNMQVDLALDNINKQVRQIDSSKEGVNQARKAREIMQKSFNIGAASYLELRDSELADTSAQLSYLQAIYNYLISTSELDLLLGKEG